MRQTRLLCLILMFCIAIVTPAEDLNSTPCSATQLQHLIDGQAELDEVMAPIETVDNISDLHRAAGAYIRWRKVLAWRTMRCSEGYNVVWRMSQLAADVYTGRMLTLLGVADSENPYLARFEFDQTLLAEQLDRIDAALVGREREDIEGGSLAASADCYFDGMNVLTDLWLQYNVLLETAQSVGMLDELLAYATGQIEWRNDAWSRLPDCDTGYLLTMEFTHTLEDFVTRTAFAFAAISDQGNPFVERLEKVLNPPENLRDHFLQTRLTVPKRPSKIIEGIPSCSLVQLTQIKDIPAQYDALILKAQDIASSEDALDFLASHVSWREELWQRLPLCAEALELGWLMNQVASDYAARHAFLFVGASALDMPFVAQIREMTNRGSRLLEARSELDAYISGETTQPAVSGVLPECETLERTGDFVAADWRMQDRAKALASFLDLVDYSEKLVKWRDGRLTRSPICAEELQIAWLMTRYITDLGLSAALELGGVPAHDNPFLAEIELTETRINDLNMSMSRDEPLPKRASPSYHSSMPACSRLEFVIVATSALTYESKLGFPRVWSLDDLVEYNAKYVDWREESLSPYPLCSQAHKIRLTFSQLLGDVIARYALDIDAVFYGRNPYRQLPTVHSRSDELETLLFRSRRSTQNVEDDAGAANCSDIELDLLSALAAGMPTILQASETLELPGGLLPFIQQLLDWRRDSLSRLPLCREAVELGYVMNDIALDLAVLHIFTYTGLDRERIPQSETVARGWDRFIELARDTGLQLDATD